VSSLPGRHGAIVFDGNNNKIPWRRRRFWVLENAGDLQLTMEYNGLTPNSRITISGFKTTPHASSGDFLDEVYLK